MWSHDILLIDFYIQTDSVTECFIFIHLLSFHIILTHNGGCLLQYWPWIPWGLGERVQIWCFEGCRLPKFDRMSNFRRWVTVKLLSNLSTHLIFIIFITLQLYYLCHYALYFTNYLNDDVVDGYMNTIIYYLSLASHSLTVLVSN